MEKGSTAAATAGDNWLPRDRAAKLLGASNRQLQRRAQQGYVETMVGARKPTERNPPVFYSKTDILALKAGTPNTHAVAVSNDAAAPESGKTARAGSGSTAVSVVPAFTPAAMPAGFVELLRGALVAHAEPRPWLTLAEAAEFSGLPASWLLKSARDGSPFALNVGSEKRAVWRFKRAGLSS